jgi:tripeptidyl-peptidase I
MTGFAFNVESNFDLSWAMALVGKEQTVTLYQVGDPVELQLRPLSIPALLAVMGRDVDIIFAGASFNNFLDALDGSYCTFEGGDDPSSGLDGVYPDPLPGGYKGIR